jgi:hypothetical protein
MELGADQRTASVRRRRRVIMDNIRVAAIQMRAKVGAAYLPA